MVPPGALAYLLDTPSSEPTGEEPGASVTDLEQLGLNFRTVQGLCPGTVNETGPPDHEPSNHDQSASGPGTCDRR